MENKETIIKELVQFIEKSEVKHGEISLFSLSHALRCRIDKQYPNRFTLDENRDLYIEAYNRTHPNAPYKRR